MANYRLTIVGLVLIVVVSAYMLFRGNLTHQYDIYKKFASAMLEMEQPIKWPIKTDSGHLLDEEDYADTVGTRHLEPQLSQTIGVCHRELYVDEDWSQPKVPDVLQEVEQDNLNLSEHVCKKWLLPPFTIPRTLRNPQQVHYSQHKQSQFVDELLNNKKNGFYVESGAAGGENLSNSLFFEKSRNWTGLLVEANPASFQAILQKHRHAYMVNACLSPVTKPTIIPFSMAGVIGGLYDYMENSHKERVQYRSKGSEIISIQCFPLFTILQAMNISHVDYFSLDIEGAELEILKTLPLDKVDVKVFSIEYKLPGNHEATRKKLQEIRNYLVIHGYKVVRIGIGADVILMKDG
jgi:hypothetical protein